MSAPFTYTLFHEALTDLMAPTTPFTGIQKLLDIIQSSTYHNTKKYLRTFTAACLELGVIDLLVRSLEYSPDEIRSIRKKETFSVFILLTDTSEGRTALLTNPSVIATLCSAIRPGQPIKVVRSALWLLGRLAIKGRATVDLLVEHGVFARLCWYTAEVFGGVVQVHVEVLEALMSTVNKFAGVYPLLPYDVLAPMVPPLDLALRNIPRTQGYDNVLQNTLLSLSHIFSNNYDYVRFDDLVYGGENSIFHNAIKRMFVDDTNSSPVVGLIQSVGALSEGIPELAFTPFVLGHMHRFALSVDFDECPHDFQTIVSTMSNLMNKSPEMLFRVIASNVLHALISRAPVRMYHGVVSMLEVATINVDND